MAELFIEDYLKKVILLEKQIGTKTKYQILDPFPLNPSDILDLQEAAKKIAEFVGLHNYVFIVAIAKQGEKVGGHIELKHGEKEVFIEISDDTAKFDTATLATLAHEITHKYLYINSISYRAELVHKYEEEVLTDITAVFLGLGKLMLNGCESQNVRQEFVPEGTSTITETLKSGYLDRSQLAFAYRLVCAMRRIPQNMYETGLSKESIQALRECEKDYGHYFSDFFHDPTARDELIEHLQTSIRQVQSILSNIDKNLLYIQSGYVNVIEASLRRVHKRFKELLVELQRWVVESEDDPCLRFLSTIQLDQRIPRLVSEVNNYLYEANRFQNNTAKLVNFVRTLGNPFPNPASDMFTIVTCRNDGTKIRLPKNKHLIVKCPKCHYQFIADTRNIKRDSLLKKMFKSLFGRK